MGHHHHEHRHLRHPHLMQNSLSTVPEVRLRLLSILTFMEKVQRPTSSIRFAITMKAVYFLCDIVLFIIVVSGANMDDDAASAISSEIGRDAELEGEETETAPEGEGDDEDSVTRCIW